MCFVCVHITFFGCTLPKMCARVTFTQKGLHFPRCLIENKQTIKSFNFKSAKTLTNFFLIVCDWKTDAHYLFGSFGNKPMQSCSVRCVSLLSSSVLASASVYSPPSDRFDHRSFISYKYMQLCP